MQGNLKSYCVEETAEVSSRQERQTRLLKRDDDSLELFKKSSRHDQAAVMTTVSSCTGSVAKTNTVNLRSSGKGLAHEAARKTKIQDENDIPSDQNP